MDSDRFVALALLTTACAASLPAATVVANMSGGDFAPLAAGAGFVLTGVRLTAWRPKDLKARRSTADQPGAIAVARDGHACATVARRPALGLRSYRLPELEPIQSVADACNDKVSISASGRLLACAELKVEEGMTQSYVRVFSFPELSAVHSWGPLPESVESLSFVGNREDKLAVAVTLVDPPHRPEDYRSRIDLYDPRSGAVVGDFSQRGRFPYLAFSPQGDSFVWAGQSGAQAWSVRSLAQLRAFTATAHTIAVALSPDGRLLATSHEEYSAGDQGKQGGGTIQIFDMRAGELLATFSSAEIRNAANAHDSDEMITDRARLKVEFELVGGVAAGDQPPVFGEMFGSPRQVVNHKWLAFSDNDTLVSAGHGFFALWTLNQEAIRRARSPH